MSAIAVRKGMDAHQAMMESKRNLVRRMHTILDPVLRVSKQAGHIGGDSVGLNTQSLLCCPKMARPTPRRVEHSSMELE